MSAAGLLMMTTWVVADAGGLSLALLAVALLLLGVVAEARPETLRDRFQQVVSRIHHLGMTAATSTQLLQAVCDELVGTGLFTHAVGVYTHPGEVHQLELVSAGDEMTPVTPVTPVTDIDVFAGISAARYDEPGPDPFGPCLAECMQTPSTPCCTNAMLQQVLPGNGSDAVLIHLQLPSRPCGFLSLKAAEPLDDQMGAEFAHLGDYLTLGLLRLEDKARAAWMGDQLHLRHQDLERNHRRLKCLYELSRLTQDSDGPAEMLLQQIVDVIPSAWRWPEITCVRLQVGDAIFQTTNFKPTAWSQQAHFRLDDDTPVTLEVCLLEREWARPEDPFIPAEEEFFDAIAERIHRIAERTRNLERLAAAERRYRRTLDAMSDNVHVVDRDLRLQLTNAPFRQWIATWGLDTDCIGKPLNQVVPFLTPEVTEHYRQVIKTGEALLNQETIEVQGEQRVYEVRKVPMPGATVCDQVLTMARDITDQARAEAELREAERQYREMTELLPDMVCEFGTDLRILYANRTALQRLGYPAGTHPRSINLPDLLSEQDQQRARDRLSAIVRTRRAGIAIYHLRTRTGESVPCEMHTLPVMDASGQVVRFRSVIRDATERLHVDHILRANEERLRTILETVQAGVVIVDADTHHIDYMNAAALKMIGASLGDVLGQRCHQFICPAEAGQCPIADLGQVANKSEGVLLRTDGTPRDIIKTVTTAALSDRRCFIETFVDITDQKRTAREREQALEQLERSNRELQEFVYVASHDLQEPLRMVASYVQLLERRYRDRLDGDALEFIGYAVDGARYMQQLINDLLSYSRVGTDGAEFEPTDLQAVLDTALRELRGPIQEQEAVITHDPLPQVLADRSQMTQLLQNLIGNSLKYQGSEPPRIHVAAMQEADGWHFTVQDNGTGIDPAYSERIFQVFQRLHTREVCPGTGIGLSICKKIVERHQGRIWVESEPEQGAAFHFTLGLTEDAEGAHCSLCLQEADSSCSA